MVNATLGIDLSSQPKRTAICLIGWSDSKADVLALWQAEDPDGRALTDRMLMDLMLGRVAELPVPSKVAIDAPLGWPVDFVRALEDPTHWPVSIGEPRQRLERRATDLWVYELTKKLPLSVTTDRVAYPAMRAAGLLAHYARESGCPVDRSGVGGVICEAYPAPAIGCLGLWPRGIGARVSYRGSAAEVRGAIVDRLLCAAPWIALSEADRQRCVRFEDCLDALVCSLTARAVARGATITPPENLRPEATEEGWIHLPRSGCLPELV